MVVRLVVFLLALPLAHGHGSMVQPPPRNAVERADPYWAGPAPADAAWSHHVDTPICPTAAGGAAGLAGNLSLAQGQSCFWFSHGCTIFCDKCDGVTGRLPYAGTCGNDKGPGKVNATICDPALRTINPHAPCNTPADFYYYNPWRAPGTAPVYDACGMAGGAPAAVPQAPVGVRFRNTSHAVQGDRGSLVLPARPTGTTWARGALAEVSWTVRTNHGGGYQYRLCPAGEELTESCFQRTPLAFEGRSALRWGGKPGKTLYFDGTTVAVGTVPAGSAWRKNPIPRIDATKYPNEGQQTAFPAPCYEPDPPASGGHGGLCSGWYGPDNLEIVDTVRVPAGLAAGEYVVQWRLDCEESAQVWLNCADITVE
eukprot:g3072.t1